MPTIFLSLAMYIAIAYSIGSHLELPVYPSLIAASIEITLTSSGMFLDVDGSYAISHMLPTSGSPKRL